jgi:hypothetical protein
MINFNAVLKYSSNTLFSQAPFCIDAAFKKYPAVKKTTPLLAPDQIKTRYKA